MASCVRNIRAKNNQNLTIGFKVTVENVGGPSFFETQCNKKTVAQHACFSWRLASLDQQPAAVTVLSGVTDGCINSGRSLAPFIQAFVGVARAQTVSISAVMECLHDPANVQETSSKCIHNTRANAGRLQDVCWIV